MGGGGRGGGVVGRRLRGYVKRLGEWGDRYAKFTDPFGHEWEIGHPLLQWPPVSASGPASTDRHSHDLSDDDDE